jgi:LmbE family N-acetylglucosaminyl deacetylase
MSWRTRDPARRARGGENSLHDAPSKRALVVMAHPDDPEFGAGGTIAAWAQDGAAVAYVIATDGSKGSADPAMSGPRLAELRQAEQRAAAAALGVREVAFLGFPDGETTASLPLRHAIAREIRRWRPDLVVTHDPATIYSAVHINHPDHRAVGQATLDAVYPTARDHLGLPEEAAEGLAPHTVAEVWLTGSLAPDTWVDVSSTLGRKIEALTAHQTQIQDPEAMAERVRKRAATVAEGLEYPYAECFKRIAFDR